VSDKKTAYSMDADFRETSGNLQFFINDREAVYLSELPKATGNYTHLPNNHANYTNVNKNHTQFFIFLVRKKHPIYKEQT
jgi:hypothetical protein